MIQSKQIRGMAASSLVRLLQDHEELCAAYAQVYDDLGTSLAKTDVIICTAEVFGFPKNQSVPQLVKWLYKTLDGKSKELAARDAALAEATARCTRLQTAFGDAVMENMRLRTLVKQWQPHVEPLQSNLPEGAGWCKWCDEHPTAHGKQYREQDASPMSI